MVMVSLVLLLKFSDDFELVTTLSYSFGWLLGHQQHNPRKILQSVIRLFGCDGKTDFTRSSRSVIYLVIFYDDGYKCRGHAVPE